MHKTTEHGDGYKISDTVHVNESLIVFEKRILVPGMAPEPIDEALMKVDQG